MAYYGNELNYHVHICKDIRDFDGQIDLTNIV